jgi:hypothetical protein
LRDRATGRCLEGAIDECVSSRLQQLAGNARKRGSGGSRVGMIRQDGCSLDDFGDPSGRNVVLGRSTVVFAPF